MKYKAIVKNPTDEVKWLIIESDESDTTGFFVYYHTTDDFAYDTWHESLANAFEAGNSYGIKKNDWQIIDE